MMIRKKIEGGFTRLAEIILYIEMTVMDLYGPAATYDDYENMCIAILDSDFVEFPSGVLQRFLKAYLEGIDGDFGFENS